MDKSAEFNLYKDIQARTNGEIYIGVVGPVRTGKSTFIKRFMDLFVIPSMDDEYEKERAIDELPQSATGTTIMTTEPKFIPKKAAVISLDDGTSASFRLVDCVGFIADGATGYMENEKERMVKTPWLKEEIPFTKAAELGTRKVIRDHATIGLVISTDGSFGEIKRESFLPAEEKTVQELKAIGKPFVLLMNTSKPFSQETEDLCQSLREKYGCPVMPVNCAQMKREDIQNILEEVLWSFPVRSFHFHLPAWVDLLKRTDPVKQEILSMARSLLQQIGTMRDARSAVPEGEFTYIDGCKVTDLIMEEGTVCIQVSIPDTFYYETLSSYVGIPLQNQYQLIQALKDLVVTQTTFNKMKEAWLEVSGKGYGVVTPKEEDIQLEMPELIRHGNKFGVKIKAMAPSVHMIRANIATEIAPIVGNEEQAKDLLSYIEENSSQGTEGILETNIFGKTIKELVDDGIRNKVHKLNEESQMKLQDTIEKVVNDSNGGLVCIII